MILHLDTQAADEVWADRCFIHTVATACPGHLCCCFLAMLCMASRLNDCYIGWFIVWI